VREEIARVAMRSPSHVGETFPHWSLRRLRSHVIARGLVPNISVEGLRQLLRGLPLPPALWRRSARPAIRLSSEVQHALESWAQGPRADRSLRAQIVLASSQGLNETEISAALHIGRETARRWLRRFRRGGILGLQSARDGAVVPSAQTRRAIVHVARSDPHRFGCERSAWTLDALRQTLLKSRLVRQISPRQLRAILLEAGIVLPADASPEELRRAQG
jgi:transposase